MDMSPEKTLFERLKLLKDIFKIDRDIGLEYHAGEEDERGVRGEVEGDTIFIYDTLLKDALDTLDHEFIEIVNRPFNNMVLKLLDANLSLTASMFKGFMESYQTHLQKIYYEIEEARIVRIKEGLPKPINSLGDSNKE